MYARVLSNICIIIVLEVFVQMLMRHTVSGLSVMVTDVSYELKRNDNFASISHIRFVALNHATSHITGK